MLKTATAASILIALLCCPLVQAQSSSTEDQSGFGGSTLPSEPTNTQSEQSGLNGDEPLAAPGATQKTGTQGSGSHNLLNLPKVTTAIISRPGTSLKDLPPARYAVLSEGDGSGGLPDARYAVLSGGGAVGASGAAGALPAARYAVLSEKSGIGDNLSKLQELNQSLPQRIRASEGF